MENKELLLSVVVCTYNRAKFVVDALDSLVAQDFDKFKIALTIHLPSWITGLK